MAINWEDKISVNGAISPSMFFEFLETYTNVIRVWTSFGAPYFLMEMKYNITVFYIKVGKILTVNEAFISNDKLGATYITLSDYNRLLTIIENNSNESIDRLSDGKIDFL